jgi:thiamine kinase-like enzyme
VIESVSHLSLLSPDVMDTGRMPRGCLGSPAGRCDGTGRPLHGRTDHGKIDGVDEIELIAARLWPGHAVTCQSLAGGITNHNVLVTRDDGARFVVRVAGASTETLGIDRRIEYQASLAAAAVGVGPPVEAYVADAECLVTGFIGGTTLSPEAVREPETLARVARALRSVHEGSTNAGRFSSFEIVESYSGLAVAHGVALPAACAGARSIARQVELARGPVTPRPCHNDLLAANLIDDGDRIRIVDWEYAGMGDVFFDLANLSANNEFGEAEIELLLESYFGDASTEHRRSLHLMRFMSDFREAMWGLVQAGISAVDFDFLGYADTHFSRLERTAADPAFQAALRG